PINVCLEIGKSIDKTIHKLIFVSLSAGEQESEFKKLGEVVVLKGLLISKYFKFKRLVNQYNPTVIHSHCFLPDVMNACLKGENTLTTVHNIFEDDYIPYYGYFKGKSLSILHRYFVKKITNVVSCSESVRKTLEDKYSLMTEAIQNGVETSKLKNTVFWREGEVKYFYLGVMNKRKNVDVLIEGFLKSEVKPARLYIVGDGPEAEKLSKKYCSFNNVIFTGRLSQPRGFIRDMDVFISSSKAEGLPMALLESIAESCTYIISDIPPHKEVHDSIKDYSGFCVENTVDGFECGFKTMQKSDIGLLQRNALDGFCSNFSSEIMALKYAKLYKLSSRQ
ncbi:TPA: glycosyltransferase family 4 protein, partial [Vibrio parahaemolyticus]